MRLRFTAEAEDDLESIADYIAGDNPARALSFVRDLRTACDILTGYPQAYPLVPRYEASGVRRKPFGNYLIFYVVKDEDVTILHILNGAQDYEAILFP